jgi:hypothetical protein
MYALEALKKQVQENTYIFIKPGIIELVQLSDTLGANTFFVVAKLSASELPTFIDVLAKSLSEIRNNTVSPDPPYINADGARCFVQDKLLRIEAKCGRAIVFPSTRHAYTFIYQIQSCILASLFENQNRKELVVQLVNLLSRRNKADSRTLIKSWSNDLDLNGELLQFCVENNISNAQEQTVIITFFFLHSDIIESLYEVKTILSQTI